MNIERLDHCAPGWNKRGGHGGSEGPSVRNCTVRSRISGQISFEPANDNGLAIRS